MSACRVQPATSLNAFRRNVAGTPSRLGEQPIMFGAASDQAYFSIQTTPQAEHAPELSKGQQICDQMIAWYQKVTRQSRLAVKLGRQETGIFGCGYKDLGLSEYSCSEYTREAIRRHGVIKGIMKGFLRILMCNPLTFHFKPLQRYFVLP